MPANFTSGRARRGTRFQSRRTFVRLRGVLMVFHGAFMSLRRGLAGFWFVLADVGPAEEHVVVAVHRAVAAAAPQAVVAPPER